MNDFIESNQLLKPLRKWWWILLLTVPLATLAGYYLSLRQSPVYEATTTINVGQFLKASQLNREDILTHEVLVQTYADMSMRQPVLQGVVDSLGLQESWEQLRKNVRVNVAEAIQLIEITTKAGTPEKAQALAESLSQQLILLSSASVQNQLDEDTRQFVTQQLVNLQTKIEDGQKRLAELNLAGEQNELLAGKASEIQTEISQLEGLINEWTKSYSQLLAFAGSENLLNHLTVIEPAVANSNPVRPRVQINLLLSAGLGLILGLGLIFLLDNLDHTISSGDDLREVLGMNHLSTVPEIQGEDDPDKLLVGQAPLSPVQETFRLLRNNIELVGTGRRGAERAGEKTGIETSEVEVRSRSSQVKSITVTSPGLGEGKSIIAANLAIAMARADLRAVLIDVNLRNPKQHKIFQVSISDGMAEYLRSPDLNPADMLKDTKQKNLQVLTSGSQSAAAIDYLNSQRIVNLLSTLNEIADAIIVDSPSILNFPETILLSNQVDASLLVIQAGKTINEDARQAVINLDLAQGYLIGVVLNRFSTGKMGRGIKHNMYQAAPEDQPDEELKHRKWKWIPGLK